MAQAIGLRERKKQQTRQAIFEAARRLFAERGFDSVTVVEIARAANVSEVTVFNYFPTKEDLFYGGMQFFEEELLEAVRSRPRGESAVTALKRKMLESADGLREKERIDAIIKAARTVSASPSLVAREREIVERYTLRLAELLAAETGADADDVEPLAAAAAMIGAHRALVDHVRSRVLAGKRGAALVEDARAQTRRAFVRLARGLGGYAAPPCLRTAGARPRRLRRPEALIGPGRSRPGHTPALARGSPACGGRLASGFERCLEVGHAQVGVQLAGVSCGAGVDVVDVDAGLAELRGEPSQRARAVGQGNG